VRLSKLSDCGSVGALVSVIPVTGLGNKAGISLQLFGSDVSQSSHLPIFCCRRFGAMGKADNEGERVGHRA